MKQGTPWKPAHRTPAPSRPARPAPPSSADRAGRPALGGRPRPGQRLAAVVNRLRPGSHPARRAPPRCLPRRPDHGGSRRGSAPCTAAGGGASATPRAGPAPGRARHQPRRLPGARPSTVSPGAAPAGARQSRSCITPYRTVGRPLGRGLRRGRPHHCRREVVPVPGRATRRLPRSPQPSSGWDASECRKRRRQAYAACRRLRRARRLRPSGSPTIGEPSWPASPSSSLQAHRRRRRHGTPGPPQRPFDGTPRPVVHPRRRGPTVGRTLAEHGAGRAARRPDPNDYEHEFIYAEANPGSRSAYLDLDEPRRPGAGSRAARAHADIVVSNHRESARWSAAASNRSSSRNGTRASCTSPSPATADRAGPWAARGGFDMNRAPPPPASWPPRAPRPSPSFRSPR